MLMFTETAVWPEAGGHMGPWLYPVCHTDS
jgi:hypothetical protein